MLRKTIVLLIFISSFASAQQAWPLGADLFTSSYNSTTDSTKYCFHSLIFNYIVGYTMDWLYIGGPNGYSDVHFPYWLGTPEVLQFQNGELHVVSNVRNWPDSTHTAYITKYSNGNWVMLDSIYGFIDDGTMHQGSWYLGGFFEDTIRNLKNVVRYDNGNLYQVGQFASKDSIFSLASHGNKLWATGNFQLPKPSDTAHVMVFDPSSQNWSMPIQEISGHNANGPISADLFKKSFYYNNESYLIRDSSIYRVKADTLQFLQHLTLGQNNTRWFNIATVPLNGKLYINSGPSILEFDGVNFKFINPGLQGIYLGTLLPFNNVLYGSYSSTRRSLSGLLYNFSFSWDPLDSLGIGYLGGASYYDVDTNCVRDSSEVLDIAFNVQFRELRTGRHFIYGLQDTFRARLVPGKYVVDTVRAIKNKHQYLYWLQSCLGDTVNVDTAGISNIYDFPFRHDGTIDYGVSINGFSTSHRHGYNEKLQLNITNFCGQPLIDTISAELTLPPLVNYVSSSPSPAGLNANSVRYSISSLDAFADTTVEMVINITPANSMGSLLWYQADLITVLDSINHNNTALTGATVTGAYDPNDKTPSVEESLPGLSQLDYHIRFQNTGNDSAVRIVVVDTLEDYFNPFSIELGPSSHEYLFKIEHGNVLSWTFENIMLPDSYTDPLGSQGFLTFSIEVDSTLPLGSIIDNDAEIYFDFQAPVHTNHAQTFIIDNISVTEYVDQTFEVYPNPSKNTLNLKASTSLNKVQLFNINGGLVKEWNYSDPGKHRVLDLRSISNGLYFLKAGPYSLRIIKSN